ncbi:MAG: uncharacterized protein KVP18_000428 [Porospora cf. gigantea A]|nr:MAG: hypothetical protein KVP18_000428 [Porospora cf. gigantea A]
MSLTTINTLWSLGRSLLRVSSLSNVSSRLTHGGFSVSWDALAEAEKALCGDQTGGSLWEVEYLKLVRLLARDWINGAKGSLEGWCRRRFFLGLLPVAMHEEYALLRTKFQTRQSVFFELVVERLEGSASGDLVPVEIQELQVFHQRKLKSRFVPPRGCFQEPLLFSTFKTDGKSQKKISELFPEENSSQAIDTTCSLSQSLLRSVIDDITTRMAQSPPAKRPRKLASLVDTDQLKTLYTQSVHDILGASYAARSNDSRSRVVEQANQFLAGQDLFTSEALESVLQEVNSAIQTAFDPNVTVAPKPDVLRSLVAAPAPPPPRPDTTLQDAGFLFKSELVAFVNGRTGAATRHDVSVPFWFLPLFHPVSEELRHLLYQVPQMDFVPADVVMGSSSSRENFGSVTASSMSLVRFLTDVLQRPVDFGSPPISSEGQLSHTELLKFGPLRLPGIICSDWTSRQPTVTNLTSAFRANPICVPCRCQGPCSETSASATADEISGQQMYVCCFSYTPPCSAVSIRLWVIPPLPPPPSSAPSPQSWRYHFPPNVPKSAQMVVGMLDVIPTAAGKHQMHNAAPHGVKYIPMGAIKQTMTSAQEQVAVLERRGIRVPFSSLRTTFPALSFEYSCAFVKPAPSYTPPSVVPQTTVPSSSPTSPPWKTPQARTRPSQGPDALKTLFRGPSNTAPWRKKE